MFCKFASKFAVSPKIVLRLS